MSWFQGGRFLRNHRNRCYSIKAHVLQRGCPRMRASAQRINVEIGGAGGGRRPSSIHLRFYTDASSPCRARGCSISPKEQNISPAPSDAHAFESCPLPILRASAFCEFTKQTSALAFRTHARTCAHIEYPYTCKVRVRRGSIRSRSYTHAFSIERSPSPLVAREKPSAIAPCACAVIAAATLFQPQGQPAPRGKTILSPPSPRHCHPTPKSQPPDQGPLGGEHRNDACPPPPSHGARHLLPAASSRGISLRITHVL